MVAQRTLRSVTPPRLVLDRLDQIDSTITALAHEAARVRALLTDPDLLAQIAAEAAPVVAAPVPDDGPPTLRVAAAREYLGGISRTTLYQLIRDGELETTRIGKQIGVYTQSMDAYLDRNRVEVRRPVRKGRR